MCAWGAEMGNRVKTTKYVFYYNYVTRFSALFPVFIVTLSEKKVTESFKIS